MPQEITHAHEWLKFAITLVTLAGLIFTPLFRLVKRYKKALDDTLADTKKALDDQTTINEKQQATIAENTKQTNKIDHSLETIKAALITMVGAEIENRCQAAINEGCITLADRRIIEQLWGDYEPLGGNHGIGSTVKSTRNLPPAPQDPSGTRKRA